MWASTGRLREFIEPDRRAAYAALDDSGQSSQPLNQPDRPERNGRDRCESCCDGRNDRQLGGHQKQQSGDQACHANLCQLDAQVETQQAPQAMPGVGPQVPCKECACMPGSATTPGRTGACDSAPMRIAFRKSDGIGTRIEFLTRLNGWPTRAPVNASRRTRFNIDPLGGRLCLTDLGCALPLYWLG